MNSTQEVNLADLTRQYRDQTPAAEAMRMLRYWRRWPRPASSQDFSVRRLCEFYCLIEIAAIANVIGSDFPEGFRRQALRHLDNPLVVVAAEGNFGGNVLSLMSALKHRILDGQGVVEQDAEDSFGEFLALNTGIEDDADCDALLGMLESGRGSDRQIMSLLSDREMFIRALASKSKPSIVPLRELHGLLKVMEFSEECERFVAGREETPTFQRAVIQYYGKWYHHRELAYLSQQVLDRFVAWNPEGAVDAAECLQCVAALAHRVINTH